MPDWLDWSNALTAIPLQVVGFAIAIWQIRKAKASSDAAREAAEAASDRIGSNLLIAVLPQLSQVETNLEWAVSRPDREAAIHYLGSWRWQASQVRGLIQEPDSSAEEFLTRLQTSITQAADAKLSLQDKAADVAKRCKSAQKAIAEVTGAVGELTAKRSLEGATRDKD